MLSDSFRSDWQSGKTMREGQQKQRKPHKHIMQCYQGLTKFDRDCIVGLHEAEWSYHVISQHIWIQMSQRSNVWPDEYVRVQAVKILLVWDSPRQSSIDLCVSSIAVHFDICSWHLDILKPCNVSNCVSATCINWTLGSLSHVLALRTIRAATDPLGVPHFSADGLVLEFLEVSRTTALQNCPCRSDAHSWLMKAK